jgi:hypothetical protein
VQCKPLTPPPNFTFFFFPQNETTAKNQRTISQNALIQKAFWPTFFFSVYFLKEI